MADRTKINMYRQNRRANYTPEEKINENNKNKIRMQILRQNKKKNVSLQTSLPFIAVDTDSSVLPERPLHSLVPLASASDAVDSIVSTLNTVDSLRSDVVVEPPASFTPSLSDNAVEPPAQFTSSLSHLKRRKISDEDDINCDDERSPASKVYNFFHHKRESNSSSILTYQPDLISSNVTSDKTGGVVLSITQNVQPPTEVRNVEY